MGQQTYTQQHSKKTEIKTVSFGDNLVISGPSLAFLFEQQQAIVTPVVETCKTSIISDVCIRGFDIAGSLIMLAIASPVMLFAAVLVRVTSPGPVLYKQHRVGRYSKIFTLYKFRTMVNDAEKIWGFTPATQDDERVTPIGRFLRRTRLDEVPQLVNVLKGEMSLVGPRPENLYRVNMHASLRGSRLLVKPGLTGLAQIRAFYDLKPEHKIKYDYLYIQKRSFFLNAYILLKTIPVVLLKKGW